MTDASDINFSVEVSKGVIAKVLMAAIGFAGTIVFARVLGATKFGGYYLVLMIVEILKKPVDGWGTAAKKRYSEISSPKDEIVGLQTLLPVLLVVVVAVGAYPFRMFIVDYTGIERSYHILVFLTGSLSLYSVFESILEASGQVGKQTGIDTFRSVITLALQGAFVWYGTGALGMAYGLAFATLASVPLLVWSFQFTPVLPTRDTIRSLAVFAKDSIPYTFVRKAWDRYDIFLIGALLSPAVVGYYEVAYKLVVPATFVSGLIGNVIMARTSNLQSKGEDTGADVANSVSFASLFAIPIFFGALVFPEKLVVTAYGSEFKSAATLLIGLALYQIFNTQSTGFTNILAGLDRHNQNVRISIISFTVNIVLGYLLIFEYGALGVVAATVVASVFEYTAGAYLLSLHDMPFVSKTVIQEVFAGGVMYVVLTVLSSYFVINSWFVLLGAVAGGGLIYFTVLFTISVRVRGVVRPFFKSVVT
jgi:O-antigen/teichoic acid export membrane protein